MAMTTVCAGMCAVHDPGTTNSCGMICTGTTIKQLGSKLVVIPVVLPWHCPGPKNLIMG